MKEIRPRIRAGNFAPLLILLSSLSLSSLPNTYFSRSTRTRDKETVTRGAEKATKKKDALRERRPLTLGDESALARRRADWPPRRRARRLAARRRRSSRITERHPSGSPVASSAAAARSRAHAASLRDLGGSNGCADGRRPQTLRKKASLDGERGGRRREGTGQRAFRVAHCCPRRACNGHREHLLTRRTHATSHRAPA